MASNRANAVPATRPSTDEGRLAAYVLTFAIAFAVFILGPPFLGYKFGPYPLMHVADVFDLLTPLVLLPLYWLLFRIKSRKGPTTAEAVLFMVFAGSWVLGQGMHLAANSIGHLTEDVAGADINKLVSFYDETLGHYLWHFGVIALSGLIAYRQYRDPLAEGRVFTANSIAAAIIYGFVFFAMVVEGVTVPMGLPFAALFVAAALIWVRKDFKRQPVVTFFLFGYAVALVLFAIWGIWHGGFPEFSKVGLIK